MRSEDQALLPSTLETTVAELANTLEKLCWDADLKESLAAEKATLPTPITEAAARDYLTSTAVQEAKKLVEMRHAALTQNMLRFCWFQIGRLNFIEKFTLTISTLVLITATVLLREAFVLLIGRPKLEETGKDIADYCTQGPIDDIVNICYTLKDSATAVFNLNAPRVQLPTFKGTVDNTFQGPIPGTQLVVIPSWTYYSAFRQHFSCTTQGNTTELVGHTGWWQSAQSAARAINAFPTSYSAFARTGNYLLDYLGLEATTMLFLAGLCTLIDEGGYSTFTAPDGNAYGSFNGFGEYAKQFQGRATAFGAAHGSLAILSFLITAAMFGRTWFQAKKAKTETAANTNTPERKTETENAHRLFAQADKLLVTDTQENKHDATLNA